MIVSSSGDPNLEPPKFSTEFLESTEPVSKTEAEGAKEFVSENKIDDPSFLEESSTQDSAVLPFSLFTL